MCFDERSCKFLFKRSRFRSALWEYMFFPLSQPIREIEDVGFEPTTNCLSSGRASDGLSSAAMISRRICIISTPVIISTGVDHLVATHFRFLLERSRQ